MDGPIVRHAVPARRNARWLAPLALIVVALVAALLLVDALRDALDGLEAQLEEGK